MGILLILAQIALIVFDLVAHVITLNANVVWLPGILFLALWVMAIVTRTQFNLDSFKHMYVKR